MAEPASDGLFGAITNFFNGPPPPQKTNQGNLSKFVHHVNSGGVAFSHLFLVSLGPKKGSSANVGGLMEKINLFCHATSIPALNIMTSPYRENAAHFEVPYGHSVEPITMNFYGERNLITKLYFDEWYYEIINPKIGPGSFGHLRIGFMQDICADIDVHIIEKNQNRIYSMRLINAFPKSIGDIQLSNSNPDIVSFPVQFVYERVEYIEAGFVDNVERPPTTRQWPLSVWDQAVGASDELMQAATKEVEGLQGTVNNLLGAPATLANEVTTTIRDRVSLTNVPSFLERFG